MILRSALGGVLLAAALVGACTSTSPTKEAAPQPSQAGPAEAVAAAAPQAPWTDAFQRLAVLVAEEVRIEGPPGLMAHCVIQQNAEFFDYEAKTTPDGFLQIATAKDGAGDQAIQAHLDGLTLAVEKRLVVLERPGPGPVIVEARGSVFLQDVAAGTEKRDEQLRLVGEPARKP